MGMFDYITCKYPLPEVDLQGTSLTQKDLAVDCQTKDLDNYLEHYTIEEDGRISYTRYQNIRYEKPKKGDGDSIMDLLGEVVREDPVTEYLKGDNLIQFGNYLTKDSDKWDYSWDFQARVDDGKVTSIKLVNFEKIDNEQRKANMVSLRNKMKEYELYKKTFRYKYFFKYVSKAKNWFRSKLINLLQKALKWACKI